MHFLRAVAGYQPFDCKYCAVLRKGLKVIYINARIKYNITTFREDGNFLYTRNS
jgi:hypothetical protein